MANRRMPAMGRRTPRQAGRAAGNCQPCPQGQVRSSMDVNPDGCPVCVDPGQMMTQNPTAQNPQGGYQGPIQQNPMATTPGSQWGGAGGSGWGGGMDTDPGQYSWQQPPAQPRRPIAGAGLGQPRRRIRKR